MGKLPSAAGSWPDHPVTLRETSARASRTRAEASKQTVMIELRDGARLATDAYLPVPADRAEQQGAVLWRACPLENGYALAVQNMPGFYASATGEDPTSTTATTRSSGWPGSPGAMARSA